MVIKMAVMASVVRGARQTSHAYKKQGYKQSSRIDRDESSVYCWSHIAQASRW